MRIKEIKAGDLKPGESIARQVKEISSVVGSGLAINALSGADALLCFAVCGNSGIARAWQAEMTYWTAWYPCLKLERASSRTSRPLPVKSAKTSTSTGSTFSAAVSSMGWPARST